MRVLGAIVASVLVLADARAQPVSAAAETRAVLEAATRHQAEEAARRRENERRLRQAQEVPFKATATARRTQSSAPERARQRSFAVTRRAPVLQVRPAYQPSARPSRPEGSPGPRGRFRLRTAQDFGRIRPARAAAIRTGSANLRIRFTPPR